MLPIPIYFSFFLTLPLQFSISSGRSLGKFFSRALIEFVLKTCLAEELKKKKIHNKTKARAGGRNRDNKLRICDGLINISPDQWEMFVIRAKVKHKVTNARGLKNKRS